MKLTKITLPFICRETVLALGSQSKNTLCFARRDCAYLTRVHPDLDRPQDFSDFRKDLELLFKKKPKIIACDLHPEYQSTKQAFRLAACGYRLVMAQHHHAHIAACMAENGIRNQKVIGVAFDGTGLGPDNTLWGGEFLLCDYRSFARRAHLKEIPLIGASQAIKEPWRLTAAWLDRIYKDKFLKQGIGFTAGIDKKKWLVLKSIRSAGVNSPLSSSMGRLFDAVSSLVLKKYNSGFEAELALELERRAYAYRGKTTPYPFNIKKRQGVFIIDPALIFKEAVKDLKAARPVEEISYRFHLSIARMIVRVAGLLRDDSGVNKVALCGGVFQNRLLSDMSQESLKTARFAVLRQGKLSPGDSGLSLGQAAVASFKE